MTHTDNALGRGSARRSDSVLTPNVQIDEARSPCPQAPLPSTRTLTGHGDFRYYVDFRGRQHFNFEQKIWLKPSVQMAVTPVMTLALQTLAINLLARTVRECNDKTIVVITFKRLLKLAKRFCAECLLTASPAGWVIPRSSIEGWLASQRRLQAPTGIGLRSPGASNSLAEQTRARAHRVERRAKPCGAKGQRRMAP
jgi:hypothetical protein